MDGRKRNRRLLPDRQGDQARAINLVVPLAHEATDMRPCDTTRPVAGRVLRSLHADRPTAFGEVM